MCSSSEEMEMLEDRILGRTENGDLFVVGKAQSLMENKAQIQPLRTRWKPASAAYGIK